MAKEQAWRIAWRARSLLSRTTTSSAALDREIATDECGRRLNTDPVAPVEE
jgi:hypothetical protein